MPVCYGESWLNAILMIMNRSGKLPPGLFDDHIRPFLAPVLGLVVALGSDVIAMTDATSGEDIWQRRLEPCFSPLPPCLVKVAHNGTMILVPFMGTGETKKSCMLNAADGHQMWKKSFWMPGAVFAPSSEMVVGTGGKVLMLHAASGKELWKRTDIAGVRAQFPPSGRILAVACDEFNGVAMLDAFSGEELWRHVPVTLVTDIQFTSNSQNLVVGAYNKLIMLKANTGESMWQRNDIDPESLLMDVDSEHVLVGSLDTLVQVNVQSGKECARANINARGKSPKTVCLKATTSDSAIAIRSNEVMVLHKQTWEAANLVSSGFAELTVANGNNVAVVRDQKNKQSVALMSSTGELLWTWERGFVDMFVRSMAFVVPAKPVSTWHHQNESCWALASRESLEDVQGISSPSHSKGTLSSEDADTQTVEHLASKSKSKALPSPRSRSLDSMKHPFRYVNLRYFMIALILISADSLIWPALSERI